jgi:hypothetical protein
MQALFYGVFIPFNKEHAGDKTEDFFTNLPLAEVQADTRMALQQAILHSWEFVFFFSTGCMFCLFSTAVFSKET